MVEPALAAASILSGEDRLEVAVINARFAKPLDSAGISRVIASGKPVLICEDHAIIGGFGSAVLEVASAAGLNASNVRLLGLPDRFIHHASRTEQLVEAGLDAAHMAATVKDMVARSADRAGRYS
jgi:1-deoxy-D-xylulose-5-phosphate synthase